MQELFDHSLYVERHTPKVVKSISDNEDDILLGIMKLYTSGEPFDLDASYSVGGLYLKNVPQPPLKYDIDPEIPGVEKADARDLPLANSSLHSIVFDPPFIFNPHGSALQKNAAAKRYTAFASWAELEDVYRGALREFYRVLRPRGVVAFKCQDYTDAKTVMTHCFVYQWAIEAGFYARDIFIRYRNHGPAYNPALTQRHARKFHSYWWVFQRQGVQ